jgi:hypothetical protein
MVPRNKLYVTRQAGGAVARAFYEVGAAPDVIDKH